MRIRLLGTAAGGGFPQWNCACGNCRNARRSGRRRMQTSAAISGDGRRWYLLHASPDIHAQIESFPPLWPQAPRRSPIAGVLLANADLDACLGLLSLREAEALTVWATPAVLQAVGSCSFAAALHVEWRPLGYWTRLDETLEVRALAAPGKPPLYASGPPSHEDNVALFVRSARRTMAWLPTLAQPTDDLTRALAEVDVLFFDGTVWTDDELLHAGGRRTALEMAHWPLSESLPWLSQFSARRILVHINNTNPILGHAPPPLGEIEVGHDGMEVQLD